MRYITAIQTVKSDYGCGILVLHLRSYSSMRPTTTMFTVPSIACKEARREIASRIREARLQSGLKQCDVAEELNISQSTYSRMERGVLAPDCAQIRVLSGLHGISILWLLGMPNFVVNAARH